MRTRQSARQMNKSTPDNQKRGTKRRNEEEIENQSTSRPRRMLKQTSSFAEEQAREVEIQQQKSREARRRREKEENGASGSEEGDEEEEEDESEESDEEGGEEGEGEEEGKEESQPGNVNGFVRRSTRARKEVTRFTEEDLNDRSEGEEVDERTRSSSARRKKPTTNKKKHAKAAKDQSSTTDSSDSEEDFERKEQRRIWKDRNRIRPFTGSSFDVDTPFECLVGGSRDFRKKDPLADIDPLVFDSQVSWSDVGGLDAHVRGLKEMVMLPLMYPELFAKFHISPPKGVLFSGPPGTGKTLVARALAATCSESGQKVTFFMRKGADCLSKWVGEAERQLRLLFEQAHAHQPSIIFFDEIDGLAPVRSSKQDQIHSSIVSTLLALMDGLDNRGQVIVIGATNRPDAIDPALRRPGRFDRELSFSLPSKEARLTILKIHTKKWEPPLSEDFLNYLAEACAGYCGADLKALCTEAALRAVRRTYPQIYESADKLLVDASCCRLERADFESSMAALVPAQHRADTTAGSQQIPKHLLPLLQTSFDSIQQSLKLIFPLGALPKSKLANLVVSSVSVHEDSEGGVNHLEPPVPYRPRMLLHGQRGMGQSALSSALLHKLEEYPLFSLDLPTLLSCSTCTSPEEAMLRCFSESRRASPSVIFWPHIDLWWATAPEALSNTLWLLLEDMPTSAPVFLFATADCNAAELPAECQTIFDRSIATLFECSKPNSSARAAFFKPLLADIFTPPRPPREQKAMQPLPKAPKIEDDSKQESSPSELQEEQTLLLHLRLFLRGLCTNLFSQFKELQEALLHDVAKHAIHPISLIDIRSKVNDHKYLTVREFLGDIDLLVSNVKEWADMGSASSLSLVNKACHLQDVVLSFVGQLDVRIAKKCEEVATKIRARRNDSRTTPQPKENSKGHTEDVEMRSSARIRGIPALPISSPVTRRRLTQQTSPKEEQGGEEGEEGEEEGEGEEEEAEASSQTVPRSPAPSEPPDTLNGSPQTALREPPAPRAPPTPPTPATPPPSRSSPTPPPPHVVLPPPKPKETRRVTASERSVREVRELLMKKTENYSVDELEVTLFKLYRCLSRHEAEWDKKNLLTQLLQELNCM